jgi:sugar phosphate isomerase/epimerase
MGFHFLEMEALGKKHAETAYANRADFKKKLDDYGVHVYNFCIVDPDLVSLDNGKRSEAYGNFERTIELGAYFGAETIHLASYAPPVEYTGPRPYDPDKEYKFTETLRVRLPVDPDWRNV